MYVVTFYSFKGGVGRTMSLVNVATQLAIAGKRVLIVDFDLEAPGVPTFSLTAPRGTTTRGIVEFVSDYRESGSAPDVLPYTYSAEKFESGGELLVMPAGSHDASYSARLNSIDWQRLYSDEDGYLLFEDLKQQWKKSLNVDYVFIDSRTGHSDVEGICTRQLPDAVCLLFFPNEQNLQGLKRIVQNIRLQNETLQPTKDPIELHFVVSNVPDLDDEDSIVSQILEKFQRELGYKDLSGLIHHYNSLSLLHQEVFAKSRPNSRLAKEYKSLAERIIESNFSDIDVAKDFLNEAVLRIRSGRMGRVVAPKLVERAEKILRYFRNDPEVAYRMGLLYEAIGRTEDAIVLLAGEELAVSADFYSLRARLHHRLGNYDEARKDLRKMLGVRGADAQSMLETLSLASRLDRKIFRLLPSSAAVQSLQDEDKFFLAAQLDDSGEELLAKAELLHSLLANGFDNGMAGHLASLVFIAVGRFEDAVKLLEPPATRSSPNIADVFNLAMAKWGLEHEPNRELFRRAIALDDGSAGPGEDPNYPACLAIATAVVGDSATARTLIKRARSMQRPRQRTFSPWSYSKVPSAEFLRHLDKIEQGIESGELVPQFIATSALNQSRTTHH